MTLPLRDYLTQRRVDVQASIKALRVELSEIDAAERALGEASQPIAPKRERGSTGTGRMTIKELAIEALVEHPGGADAQTILSWIRDKFGLELARESLSPQLSRLGQEGVVTRDGLIWRIPGWSTREPETESHNDETPDVAASGVSKPAEEIDIDDLLG